MSPVARITAFLAALALLFAGAALAGAALEPRGENPTADDERGGHAAAAGDDEMTTSTHSEQTAAPHESEARPVRGLAVAEEGLRVVVDDPELTRGREERLRFRIADERGQTVRDFEVEHEKRMHLIVARRDLTGFQHLHPEQAADGSWSVPVRLGAAGSYRLFADFSRGGEAYTLASDLRVDGPADLKALPAPEAVATTDGGYEVRLDAGETRAGAEADLRFTIRRDGDVVDTEPYLGAGGHLVALREGDLAFLHVHPTGDGVAFAATFPTTGRYRLFLQFKHEGRVHTAAFTHEVR